MKTVIIILLSMLCLFGHAQVDVIRKSQRKVKKELVNNDYIHIQDSLNYSLYRIEGSDILLQIFFENQKSFLIKFYVSVEHRDYEIETNNEMFWFLGENTWYDNKSELFIQIDDYSDELFVMNILCKESL